MATTLKDARRMLNIVRRKGVIAMVNFSKRNASCIQEAHDFITHNGIGAIRHVEASYLQSWLVADYWGDWRTKSALTWRLSTRHGSAGVLGDLGCHIYDVAGFLCSDIDEIACRLKTFDKGVHSNKIGEYVLDANDSFISTVIFKNGAIGTIHSSRWATGYLDRFFIRVHGDGGAIDIDFNRSMNNYLLFTAKKKKWELIKCKSTLNNYERFVHAIKTGKNDVSDFENGVKVQAYLHYSFLSDTKKCALKVKS